MGTISRAIAFLAFTVSVSWSATLDIYGGRTDMNCVGGATGAFYTEKLGAQWYLCTPSGHPMWGQGAYASKAQVTTPKYGNDAPSAQSASRLATVNRLQTWGFNLLPPYSDGGLFPYQAWMSTHKIPYMPIFRPGLYGMARNAVAGTLDDAIKDLYNGMSPYVPLGNPNGMVDWGDTTRLRSALHYMLAVDTNDFAQVLNGNLSLDYVIGIAIEDSDQTWAFWGAGQSDPFDTYPSSKGSAHGGYVTAVMSPTQQAEGKHWNLLYSDNTVKTKMNWKTYLQSKYTTTSALNSAWGSTYTTFDSSGATVSGESFSTTDGVSASFSHTLANAGAVSPNSVKVYQDGTLLAGDCFHPNTGDACNPISGTTWGAIWGPSVPGGSINYSTKGATVNFSGTFNGLNQISCSGVSCAGEININDDTSFGVTVGDKIMVRFSTCCSTTAETVSAKSGAASCTNGHGATCYTYTWSNNAGGSGTEQYYGTPRYVNDQAAKIAPPSAGHVLTVTYQVGGWGAGGTGLLDEDGRPSHTWLGTDHNALSNANATFAVDARAWLGSLATTYFGAMASQISADFTAAGAAVPMYVGPDSFGTWSTPPRQEVVQAASPYFGMAIMGLSSVPLTQDELDFMTTYFNKPFFGASFLHSQVDSPYASNPQPGDYATQALRGAAFISSIQSSLASRSNGVNPYLGNLWWSYADMPSESTNWGLVTIKDNAYDGNETVTGTVTCSIPETAYSCGGEAANYGDVITSVKIANALWMAGLGSFSGKVFGTIK